MGDAVQEIGILVKHELVTLIQNWQEPPPRFFPVPDVAPLKQNAFGLVSPAAPGLPSAAQLVGELYQVFSVLKPPQVHQDEKIVGRIGLCRSLNL